MFIAINDARERVLASKALSRDTQYFCPICGGTVRLRAGDSNIAHFAHAISCTDDFTHDMSEWHRAWQELFPLECREVVISHNGETHRADVLCYGTVIEFQHSPISAAEFKKRNSFYTGAGYHVVWIFDLIDAFDSSQMRCDEDYYKQWDHGGKFKWNRPWRFWGDFLPQYEKNIDIFFQTAPFGKDPKDRFCDGYIEKVTWVRPNYRPRWGYFHTSYKITNYAELWESLKANEQQ